MPSQLVKLTPPRLGKVYLRTRLFEILNRAKESHQIIWIGAPAGAGKTTLVVSYLQQLQIKTLWYSVDEGDSDPASLFYYVGLAAKQAGIRKTLPLFTPDYQLGLNIFSRNYFRELYSRLKTPAVLVLDNLQDAIQSELFRAILQQALQEIPPEITVLIISRTQPPLELARLRMNNLIAELGWDDLQLSVIEHHELSAALFEKSAASKQQLDLLYQRTQGWITAVVLAMRRGMLTNDMQNELVNVTPIDEREKMFEYFATQVLAGTDNSTREFLYSVALLPIMTVKLCRELTGNSSAKDILQRLDKNYFFITNRGVLSLLYEFHPLFREYLLNQAATHLNHERLVQLKRKAGQILLKAGEIEHAASLTIASQDWRQLADILMECAESIIKQGRHLTLLEWYEYLPSKYFQSEPWLLYWKAIAISPTNPAESYLNFSNAYEIFQELSNARGLYQSWIGAVENLFSRHDDMEPAQMWIEKGEQLRQKFPDYPDLELRGRFTMAFFYTMQFSKIRHPQSTYWLNQAEKFYRFIPSKDSRCIIGGLLGMYYAFFGEIRKLQNLSDELMPLAKSDKIQTASRILAYNIIIIETWQSARREIAYELFEKASQLITESGAFAKAKWIYSGIVTSCLVFGDIKTAQVYLAKYKSYIIPNSRLELGYYHWYQGWIHLIMHQPEQTRTHLQITLEIYAQLNNQIFLFQAHGALVQVLTELQEFELAKHHLTEARNIAHNCENIRMQLYYCNYLEAYLHIKSGQVDRAIPLLKTSFRSATSHGWIAQAYWETHMLADLCSVALLYGIEIEFCKKLIKLFSILPRESTVAIDQWPYPIKVYTLGRFSLLIDDIAPDMSGKSAARPIELLKCLIAFGGRHVAQERLIEALWPDAEGDAGTKVFHTTLHRLRKIFKYEDSLILKDGLLSLDTRYVWADNWTLERMITQLDTELQKRDQQYVEILATQLLHYYKGPFLSHEKDQIWSFTYRERIQLRMLRCLSALANYYNQNSRVDNAIAICETILKIDQLHEPTYQQLLRIYLHAGRFVEAATTYERCRKIFTKILGVMPSTDTTALYNQIPRH